jgi:PAS domain S-box-containing protein
MQDELRVLLLEEAPDGVVLLDGNTGRVVEANTEYQRQAGRALEELRRMPVWQLCPPFIVELERVRFREAAQGGEARLWQLSYLRPDGTELPVEVRARPLDLRGKRYLLAVSRDITERRTAERLLRGEFDELRRLERLIGEKASA